MYKFRRILFALLIGLAALNVAMLPFPSMAAHDAEMTGSDCCDDDCPTPAAKCDTAACLAACVAFPVALFSSQVPAAFDAQPNAPLRADTFHAAADRPPPTPPPIA